MRRPVRKHREASPPRRPRPPRPSKALVAEAVVWFGPLADLGLAQDEHSEQARLLGALLQLARSTPGVLQAVALLRADWFVKTYGRDLGPKGTYRSPSELVRAAVQHAGVSESSAWRAYCQSPSRRDS